MSTLSKPYLTPEQYLEIERKAEFKSEYYQGEMFAMSGARRAHNLIATNTVGELYQQLLERPCEVYSSDMRVKVSSTGLYTYPDVVVVCGEPQFLTNSIPCSIPRSWSRSSPNPPKLTTASRSSNCMVPWSPLRNT